MKCCLMYDTSYARNQLQEQHRAKEGFKGQEKEAKRGTKEKETKRIQKERRPKGSKTKKTLSEPTGQKKGPKREKGVENQHEPYESREA